MQYVVIARSLSGLLVYRRYYVDNGRDFPPLADSRVRTPSEKAARSCSKCNSRRDLLQNPIGTLVGTTAIAAKCEDVSLSENLSMGTCGVLISPSIRCRASHCTINPDVCHELLLLGRGSDTR